MASQAFDFDANSGVVQTSSAVSVGGGESLRVRFSRFNGPVEVFLKIAANSVTTYVSIEDDEAWATGGVISGDSCSVEARLLSDASNIRVTGIIETF